MFALFQDQLGDIVYAQPPEAGTEVDLDGKLSPNTHETNPIV